ncbi:YwbE family protein [Phosphitispora sp. TUW77]
MEETKLSEEHTIRKNIKPGLMVVIVEKQNQRSGKLTTGEVQNILTNSQIHPRGIKVRLTTGEVGRVQQIIK